MLPGKFVVTAPPSDERKIDIHRRTFVNKALVSGNLQRLGQVRLRSVIVIAVEMQDAD
jgi:hypothetical protein